MLDSLGRASDRCLGVYCDECPFSSTNNGKKLSCGGFELEYPEEAVAIVEKWAEEHPRKTMLQDILEKYPSITLGVDGTPRYVCPRDLDYDEKYCDPAKFDCIDCWNRPIE